MPTKTFQRLLARANNQFGYLTPADASDVGVGPGTLRSLAARGQVAHVAWGLYRMPDVPYGPLDSYMEAALRVGGDAVLSHESALELYDVCDISPTRLHLTVPTSYRTKRTLPSTYELHFADLKPDQTTHLDGIPIVTLKKAIWGAIENLAGEYLISQAIASGAEAGLLPAVDEKELSSYKLLCFGGALARA